MSIPELEQYFKIKELPQEFYLNSAVKIIDVPKFIETQFIQVKSQGIKSPAYDRLIELKTLLDEESL